MPLGGSTKLTTTQHGSTATPQGPQSDHSEHCSGSGVGTEDGK